MYNYKSYVNILEYETDRLRICSGAFGDNSGISCSSTPIYLKYTDRQAWAKGGSLDQPPQNAASDQSLHCLPFMQQFSDISSLQYTYFGLRNKW